MHPLAAAVLDDLGDCAAVVSFVGIAVLLRGPVVGVRCEGAAVRI